MDYYDHIKYLSTNPIVKGSFSSAKQILNGTPIPSGIEVGQYINKAIKSSKLPVGPALYYADINQQKRNMKSGVWQKALKQAKRIEEEVQKKGKGATYILDALYLSSLKEYLQVIHNGIQLEEQNRGIITTSRGRQIKIVPYDFIPISIRRKKYDTIVHRGEIDDLLKDKRTRPSDMENRLVPIGIAKTRREHGLLDLGKYHVVMCSSEAINNDSEDASSQQSSECKQSIEFDALEVVKAIRKYLKKKENNTQLFKSKEHENQIRRMHYAFQDEDRSKEYFSKTSHHEKIENHQWGTQDILPNPIYTLLVRDYGSHAAKALGVQPTISMEFLSYLEFYIKSVDAGIIGNIGKMIKGILFSEGKSELQFTLQIIYASLKDSLDDDDENDSSNNSNQGKSSIWKGIQWIWQGTKDMLLRPILKSFATFLHWLIGHHFFYPLVYFAVMGIQYVSCCFMTGENFQFTRMLETYFNYSKYSMPLEMKAFFEIMECLLSSIFTSMMGLSDTMQSSMDLFSNIASTNVMGRNVQDVLKNLLINSVWDTPIVKCIDATVSRWLASRTNMLQKKWFSRIATAMVTFFFGLSKEILVGSGLILILFLFKKIKSTPKIVDDLKGQLRESAEDVIRLTKDMKTKTTKKLIHDYQEYVKGDMKTQKKVENHVISRSKSKKMKHDEVHMNVSIYVSKAAQGEWKPDLPDYILKDQTFLDSIFRVGENIQNGLNHIHNIYESKEMNALSKTFEIFDASILDILRFISRNYTNQILHMIAFKFIPVKVMMWIFFKSVSIVSFYYENQIQNIQQYANIGKQVMPNLVGVAAVSFLGVFCAGVGGAIFGKAAMTSFSSTWSYAINVGKFVGTQSIATYTSYLIDSTAENKIYLTTKGGLFDYPIIAMNLFEMVSTSSYEFYVACMNYLLNTKVKPFFEIMNNVTLFMDTIFSISKCMWIKYEDVIKAILEGNFDWKDIQDKVGGGKNSSDCCFQRVMKLLVGSFQEENKLFAEQDYIDYKKQHGIFKEKKEK